MFDNTVNIVLRDGSTNEIKENIELHNDINEDIITHHYQLYRFPSLDMNHPQCALYLDGPKWDGFVWNPKNPWCPYTITKNRTADASADTIYQTRQSLTSVNGKWKLFYRWNKLPDDILLKAVGLINWFGEDVINGVLDSTTILTPDTLLILPAPITVKGRKLGTQVPDILEITYWLSITGVE